MQVRSLLAAAAALLLANVPAYACLPDIRPYTPDQIRAKARTAFAEVPLIVDAEVVQPVGGGVAALKVLRVIKGDPVALVRVDVPSSCDLGFANGTRLRVLLRGGPERYHAPYDANGFGIADPSAAPIFAAEIDRLAGPPARP